MGVIAHRIGKPWTKNFVIVVFIIYIYGAVCLKYAGGARSFDDGIAFTVWGNLHGFEEWLGFDPYYFGLLVFGSLSCYFSFGNIENAKTL